MAAAAASATEEVSEERIKESDELKAKANDLFKNEKYNDSIDVYTKAIEINPNNAVLYANRSLANLRVESFGYALADANKALECDKTYLKVHRSNIVFTSYACTNREKNG